MRLFKKNGQINLIIATLHTFKGKGMEKKAFHIYNFGIFTKFRQNNYSTRIRPFFAVSKIDESTPLK